MLTSAAVEVGSVFARAASAARRVSALLDRHPVASLAPVLALIAITTSSLAVAKPLWHDEIYTVLLARLSVTDLWNATRSGVDLSPPLNTMLTHAAGGIGGTGSLALRLPPLVGFWIAVAVVFEYVRRRSNTIVALAAAMLPCFTAGYRYAYEARGYGVMMGLAALALFAWSEAAAGRNRRVYLPVLAVSLSAGYWNQYYALFAAAPLLAGELARSAQSRKLDAGVWTAVALSLLAFAPLLPLVSAAAEQAPSFWRKAALSDISVTYGFLFGSLLDPPLYWGALGAVLISALARVLRVRDGTRPAIPVHELAALATCVALPTVQVAAAVSTTGVFVPRYALVAVPGFCMAVAVAVARLTRFSCLGQAIWAAVLITTLAATVPIRFSFANPIKQRPALMRLLAQGDPVVVTGGLMYLQLWYYSPPAMGDRLYYLADPDAALAYTGSDTIDRGLLGLAQWSPLNIVRQSAFTDRHSEFRIYGAGSGWLLRWLADNGAVTEQEGSELGAPILHVRVRPGQTRSD